MTRRTFAKWPAAPLCALAVLAGAALARPAAAVTVKLATLVPDGSVWDKELKRMGSEWRRDTGGRVELRVYPGGVAGDEGAVVRKMRLGVLDAATMTVGGLSDIDPAFSVFNIPLFFDSYDELFHVVKALEPVLVERLRAQGFELLGWGHAGWIHVFSTQRISSLADLKKLKMFVGAGDSEMTQFWKRSGFRAVPLSSTDILTGLKTGMIDVYPATPLAALSFQWFRDTPYMHGLGIAPLVGATVFTARTWARLEPADQKALVAGARRVEKNLETEIPAQDSTAVAEMEQRGLSVVEDFDPAEWQAEADAFARTMVEIKVPREIYDAALAARDDYRRQQGSGR